MADPNSLDENKPKDKWIGHHCDGRRFFFQLSFLSSQKPGHFLYNIKPYPPQKHQSSAVITKSVTVATHLIVWQTKFCSKIPSVAKINFQLSCFSNCVIYLKFLSLAKREVLDSAPTALTADSWQIFLKKSIFPACHCQRIYRVEQVGLFFFFFFLNMLNFG